VVVLKGADDQADSTIEVPGEAPTSRDREVQQVPLFA